MNQQRPQFGRRGSLGGASGLVRSPSSSLLSAQMPAQTLLSTPNAYARGGSHYPVRAQHQPEVSAAAWAGGKTTTLQFAVRAGDKELIRQERARLARLGISPEEEDDKSSDESDRSFCIPVQDTRLPPYNNRRRTSLADYTGVNSGYATESRGRPSARPPPPGPYRPPSPGGYGPGFRPASPGPMYGRSSARPPSPARQLPSPNSLGRSGSVGGLRSASRDRAGSTPGAGTVRFGGLGPLTMGQAPARRPPSPARPPAASPITVRGFDVPGGPSTSLRPPTPTGKRFGFGSPAMGDLSSSRVARGRAGSISSGLGGGYGSPPTPEAEVRASFDIQQLGSRRRMSVEERRAIEQRIARGYRSP